MILRSSEGHLWLGTNSTTHRAGHKAAVGSQLPSQRHTELLWTITLLSSHVRDPSLELLAAKSVENGSDQLLAAGFIPTRNFSCSRGLLEPCCLQTLQERAEMNAEISTFPANPRCAKTLKSAYQQDLKTLQSLCTLISN